MELTFVENGSRFVFQFLKITMHQRDPGVIILNNLPAYNTHRRRRGAVRGSWETKLTAVHGNSCAVKTEQQKESPTLFQREYASISLAADQLTSVGLMMMRL